MRDHVIKELTNIAKVDPKVYLLTGDLGYKVLEEFEKTCPQQFINVGIAEANMTSIAAGLALEGNTVFTYSIGNFNTLRCLEQIRNDVCYPNANVKILSVGGGFVYGNQGITHHATEDIAIMRSLPRMRVYVPGDAYEAVACLKDACSFSGPAYIRLARNKETNYHNADDTIDVNNIQYFTGIGEDVTILTAGTVLAEGISLQKNLHEKGYNAGIASVPKVKPINEEEIQNIARKTKLIVTIEEHQANGGFGGTCAEIISGMKGNRAQLYRAGIPDTFTDTCGDELYLRDQYKISATTLEPIIVSMLEKNK